jgi:hypothetical protein
VVFSVKGIVYAIMNMFVVVSFSYVSLADVQAAKNRFLKLTSLDLEMTGSSGSPRSS